MTQHISNSDKNKGKSYWRCNCGAQKGAFIWANLVKSAGEMVLCKESALTPLPQQTETTEHVQYDPPQRPVSKLSWSTYRKWCYILDYVEGTSEEEGRNAVEYIFSCLETLATADVEEQTEDNTP